MHHSRSGGGGGRHGANTGAAAKAAAKPAAVTPPGPDTEYLGMVKSYNDRRGFGFILCAETTAKYGRDVYIAKAEAQLAFSESGATLHTSHGRSMAAADKQMVPALAEDDYVRFHVKLSLEGFPQAERIRLVRKFQGIVVTPPAIEGEHAGGEEALAGRVLSEELGAVCRDPEVVVRRSSCGQVRLAPGDRVSFCVEGSDARPREAQLVLLVPGPQQGVGSILGCCVLHLPRAPLYENGPMRQDLWLDCHALWDRIILAGLPPDVDDAELLRFFSKQGATGATLAHSRSGSFASISFPGTAEVVRFAARSVHTFADDKETRTARLLPRCACGPHAALSGSRLPGLPAPALTPGDEAGVLLVMWSPVVLATGYLVEMRPAGIQAAWCAVNATDGRLGGEGGGHFGRECSSCRVSGLPVNTVFEARVTYYTDCCCRSDASDPSEWCMPLPTAAPMPGPGALAMPFAPQPVAFVGAAGGAAGGLGYKSPWPQAALAPPVPAPMASAWPNPWQMAAAAAKGMGMAPMMGDMTQVGLNGFCGAACQMGPSWRCAHGAVIAPPSMPELRAADETGYALLIRWPAVISATAYVVELLESGSNRTERFMRSVPSQSQGSIVELRVGGLRPGPSGRCYMAQVRSLGHCGCESEPSPPGLSPPIGASGGAGPGKPPPTSLPTLSLANACPPPSYTGGAATTGEDRLAASKLGRQQPGGAFTPGASGLDLPTLLQAPKHPIMPPPTGPPPMGPGGALSGMKEEIPPEVAGNEDCIILD